MDLRWFVEVDFGIARKRLVDRHLKAGIAANIEEAEKRADENDLLNGNEIAQYMVEVDDMVVSREDEKWAHGQGEGSSTSPS